MNVGDSIELTRDVEASIVPAGDKVTLLKGEEATLSQALGGYTVIVRGNMFRLGPQDADALGIEVKKAERSASGTPRSKDALEKEIWVQLKNCYDPEIPVNIVDLGLVYGCTLEPIGASGNYKADVKMTLTAPGCGMGPVLAQDVQNRLLGLEEIEEANVEIVWDPPWNQGLMTDAAKLQLGLM
ncbi:MAG: putative Fe-S cluster assembly protein SufT [Verrucomicrobia bacterium]|nr:putative Fe-S cluster assembly protein SufT [Verrucomicrobiota bacterium]